MPDEKGEPRPKVLTYGANSQKSRQEPEPEDHGIKGPIISGGAVERKEPLRKKFLSAYAGDSAQSVGNYLLMDVVIPSTKNLIADLVTQGINRILFGTSRPSGGGVSSVLGTRTSYGSFFNGGGTRGTQPQQQTGPTFSAQARANHQFNEIILNSRADGEFVLDALRELVDNYGSAKVVDLYKAVGITPDFTDQKFGWTNLARAQVLQIREGYLLDLPKPEVLP